MTFMRLFATTVAFCLLSPMTIAAAAEATYRPTVSSLDIGHFWEAYDAAVKVDDPAQQRAILQRLYIDRGTPGLQAFMQAKNYTAQSYVDAIRTYPRYWASIRSHTLRAPSAIASLEPELRKFQAIYPELRPASIYFAIGALKSGGTTQGDKVLIGAELATGDESVDISEMPPKMQTWLTGYFRSRPFDNMVLLTVHEFVHTQERGPGQNLLGQAVYEGVADFVAEQVTGRKPQLPYIEYGPKNDSAIKAAFVKDMEDEDTSGWLYNNTNNPFGVRDLGYYVGYAISQAYYQQAPDKHAAIKQMIELDFADKKAVKTFVDKSGYFD
ncbi:hypothetical protein SAMN05216570_3653 [Dyella sp. OK004]|uniref:DUF2268 domain-containing protein n=1 Tax=Dyella sp. OK004 TaxID=1855292 RepID=UPI0008EAF547|nr:DUF2268 domain-containing protein [Dyella sp. OK004]SFS17785.1 hypothetical protein SAMN05216570_3653 [Dyella sp. OK004]